jgi:hypothetical protein
MAVELHPVRHLRVGVVDRLGNGSRRVEAIATEALSIAIRGLLVGSGIGVLLMSGGHAAIGSTTILGILALGATLLSWER